MLIMDYNISIMKKRIAVLTSGWTVDYVLSVIEGMKKVCEDNNTDLFVFTCYKFIEPSGEQNTTSFKVFDLINFKEYDGIVIMPGLFNDEEMVQKYANAILESGVPAVSIGRRLNGFHYVGSDNQSAINDLVLHIIQEHGATKFAFMSGPEGDYGAESGFNVFKSTLVKAGFNPKKDILFVGYTDWAYNSAYDQACKIFEDKSRIPNAIVCINYSVTMAVIKAAVENGYSVPEDIIIISLEDGDLSTKVIPSFTAINVNSNEIGAEAINLLLNKPSEISAKVVIPSIYRRQSCGCKIKITPEQKIYSQGFVKELDREQRFASHLRFIEERFLKNETIPELSDDLQNFYSKRHVFEGNDFALFIDVEVINNITETLTDNLSHTSYGRRMQSIVNIQNGEPATQCTINTADLLPPNMNNEQPGVYLFLPVFIQKNVYGYYVSKNSTVLILNKAAYNWTRNIGNCIEKYRQTSVYRRMSQQLQIHSTQDALSGLLNRNGLYAYGEEIYEANKINSKPTEVLFVDINDLKIINDLFGHLHGDFAIKTVAEAISTCIPENYIAVRYGGDEFVIIGTATEKIDCENKITEQLFYKVIQMALPYKLTVSIGSKVFLPNEYESLNDAINVVDKIMYEHKVEYHRNND